MLTGLREVKARIEQLRFSVDGYRKQLAGLALSPERKSRLATEVEGLVLEIETLEKLAGVLRVEPDEARVETVVRDRLADLEAGRVELGDNGADGRLRIEAEKRALLWALGEDSLSVNMRSLTGGTSAGGAARAERQVPPMLVDTLLTSDDPDARVTAAHEIGVLQVSEAIPQLLEVLPEGGLLAEVAVRALSRFPDGTLTEHKIPAEVMAQIQDARR